MLCVSAYSRPKLLSLLSGSSNCVNSSSSGVNSSSGSVNSSAINNLNSGAINSLLSSLGVVASYERYTKYNSK